MFYFVVICNTCCSWLIQDLGIIITFVNLMALPLAGCHADVVHINLQHEAGLTPARCFGFEAANKVAVMSAEGPSIETDAAFNVTFISLR